MLPTRGRVDLRRPAALEVSVQHFLITMLPTHIQFDSTSHVLGRDSLLNILLMMSLMLPKTQQRSDIY